MSDVKVSCIICDVECGEVVKYDSSDSLDVFGTIFSTTGNYGSTHLDFEENVHYIVICNDCFPKVKNKVLIVQEERTIKKTISLLNDSCEQGGI
jgi:hypothetical protein